MTKLIKSSSSSLGRQIGWKSLLVGLAAVGVLLTTAGLTTKKSLQQLANFDPAAASQTASRAQLWLKPIYQLSSQQIVSINGWWQTLEIIQHSVTFLNWKNFFSLTPNTNPPAPPDFTQLFNDLDLLTENYQNSILLTKFAPTSLTLFVNYWADRAEDWQAFITFFFQAKLKVLILFQNSNELRASGGFMGSYAIATFQNGQITELSIEDIYDADGQFQGFISPPPGVQKYLSSNRGMRLPDSNWSPDFAQSAQQALEYFAFADRSDIDLVIAINQSLVEDLLRLTGPVYLPDYHTLVDENNLSQVLENRQDPFFAGSIRKKHLISHFLTQLNIKLKEVGTAKVGQLLELFQRWQKSKIVQFYSPNPDIEKSLDKLNLSGTWLIPENSDIIVWIESNVGINKVNAAITRQLDLKLSEFETIISAEFTNQDLTQRYLNYQRIWVAADWQFISAESSGSLLQDVETHLIKDSHDNSYLEVAFLIEVSAGKKQNLQVNFSRKNSPRPADRRLMIIKQAGLPATPITITLPETSDALVLDEDLIL